MSRWLVSLVGLSVTLVVFGMSGSAAPATTLKSGTWTADPVSGSCE